MNEAIRSWTKSTRITKLPFSIRTTSTNSSPKNCDRSAGLRSRWRNSWQIIIDRVAISNLRKHHESPRRASVITARNCKSISCGHPFAPARPSGVPYPFEVQQKSFVHCSSHKAARFPTLTNVKRFQIELSESESNARSIAGNRREVLGSCEKSNISFAGAVPWWSFPPGDAFLSSAGRYTAWLNHTSRSKRSRYR